ncbi:hypothetical protein EAMG_05561 [Escherichia coli M056]|uniref:hypothetical protein n=1 Tax=Escherichia coli TaxID=562 RepID=UPI000A186753|nr:hypothetical protein [Escherichia coli]OSK16260.1 hypothetical protein EAMG_05561 [Escherichia coli M056]
MSATKYQYVAILMGITLSVICSADPDNYLIALWRGVDIIIGSLSAVCLSLLIPQRAEVHWRITYKKIFADIRSSLAYIFSKNTISEKQQIKKLLLHAKSMIDLNSKLYAPLSKEIKIPVSRLKQIDDCSLEIIINIELIFNSIWISQKRTDSVHIVDVLSGVNTCVLEFFEIMANHLITPNVILLEDAFFRLKEKAKILKDIESGKVTHQMDIPDVWLELNMINLIESLETYILFMYTHRDE